MLGDLPFYSIVSSFPRFPEARTLSTRGFLHEPAPLSNEFQSFLLIENFFLKRELATVRAGIPGFLERRSYTPFSAKVPLEALFLIYL